MKLLFFCGSLEPGQDGVGDYTLRLAAECIRLGHPARIVALHDRKVTTGDVLDEEQEDADVSVRCLRLPPSLAWSTRFSAVGKWISEVSPDLCSLQYVPFSFHDKGMSTTLGAGLQKLSHGLPWHLMFHELWIDWHFPLPLRQRILGQMQKPLVRLLVKNLRPIIIHTHLAYYQQMLRGLGITSSLHPLHGNIPVVANPTQGKRWMAQFPFLREQSDVLHLGFFGALLDTLDIGLLEFVLVSEKAAGRSLLITSAGHLGERALQLWQQIESMASAYGATHRFGPLSASDISHYLASLDIGLTSYSAELAGKSGAVAAMHEHGIPVCPVGALREREQVAQERLTLLPPVEPGLNHLARKFLMSIGQN